MANSSISMPSLTEPAWLSDRSKINLWEPSFLSTMPIGEQWKKAKGGGDEGAHLCVGGGPPSQETSWRPETATPGLTRRYRTPPRSSKSVFSVAPARQLFPFAGGIQVQCANRANSMEFRPFLPTQGYPLGETGRFCDPRGIFAFCAEKPPRPFRLVIVHTNPLC